MLDEDWIKKFNLQRRIAELVESFSNEMQKMDYNSIYNLFRIAEKRIGMQKVLPKEYLEDF